MNGSSTQVSYDSSTSNALYSETIARGPSGAITFQRDVFDTGTTAIKYLDVQNTHPYRELDISEDSTGKVTAAQAQLDQNIIAAGGSVGQIFGSAIGRALAPNNQFAQLAVGTVAGLIGQKLLQTFTASLTVDASRFVVSDFASVSGLDVTNAGLGAIASFLTAELGTELHLTGFGAQLFSAGTGGYLGSVLNQVASSVAKGATLDAAIGVINWSTAATQAGYNISAAFGSYLAHEFVPAESHTGEVGGQLFGAVGSALGLSAVINASLTGILGFLIPGLGSFFGTIIGTLLGDAFAGDPANPKATHDVEILGNDLDFQNRLVGTDDHGNAAISKQMGDQVTAIANSYLDAVHGAAIDHRGHVMIGYNSGAAPYPYITGWFPNGTEPVPHFAATTDAIQEGVRELLMQTEVIGGDLLIKRAHQAFISGPHPDPNSDPSNFTDLIALSGNLSVAQDYENYLNNREAINALIAANPDTAFAAGWIATFARVNDLKLNQYVASDFLGGLVGYLDSVAKAGIAFDAAGASVSHSGAGVTVGIKVPNGVDIPGALSVFANQTSQSSDATGTTVQLTFTDGLAAGGFHLLAAGSTSGDGFNDLWFGPGAGTGFVGTGGNDILIGGGGPDSILGGDGWDFIDGGAGGGQLFGEAGDDILRGGSGNDALFGGPGNDTYAFNRGGGADIVLDEVNVTTTTTVLQSWWADDDGDGTSEFHQQWVTTTTTDHPDAGNDTLAFGPGIGVADIRLQRSGNDLVVGVSDPAHPGAPSTDQVVLQHWFDDPKDRVENFRFADSGAFSIAAILAHPGTDGPDALTWTDGAAWLDGGPGNDVLTTGAFNDTLRGGPGNDLLFGGAGTDTAVYSGPASAYTVLSYNGTVAVLSHGPDGIDRLQGIESIQFSDSAMAASAAAVFDPWEYIASNGDLIAALGANPQAGFDHYITYGYNENRATHSFDAAEYLASNTDLINAFGFDLTTAKSHYITNGYFEHRPTNSFDALEYIASNGDLIQAHLTATAAEQHYITYGFNEHRATHSFDAIEYLASNPDLIDAFGFDPTTAKSHYVTNGYFEHRPIDSFDALEYIASNKDLIQDLGLDPAAAEQQYITTGSHQARELHSFDAAQYLANYGDLVAAFGSDNLVAARQHYITNGFYEGRTDGKPGHTTVNHTDGTSTVTDTDTANAFDWASFRTDQDAQGRVTGQLGYKDSGAGWLNAFDVNQADPWEHYTSTFDAGGNLLTQAMTNDDGTHTLGISDPANAYPWSTFTLNFDAGWNFTSIGNVDNDDGSHTADLGKIWTALDTMTWYPAAHTPNDWHV